MLTIIIWAILILWIVHDFKRERDKHGSVDVAAFIKEFLIGVLILFVLVFVILWFM